MPPAAAPQKPNTLAQIVDLRLTVGFLGSRSVRGWWDCDFLSPAGLGASEYNFPRSPVAASHQATSQAAKIHHDEAIGRNRSWHLFRLPTQLEARLHQLILSGSTSLNTSLLHESKAMAFLAELADGEIDPPDGPVQIGTPEDCASEAGISELAKHYHAAFRSDRTILPYFANV
jgi:hypothetical protein